VVHLPKSFEQVAKKLVNPRVLNSRKFREREAMIDWGKVHPDIKRFAQAFHKECKRRGIPLWIFELYRTPYRQEQLRKQKRSRAGPNGSPHQFGCAVDIISADKLWDLTNKEWQLIRTIGFEIARKQNLKLVWGGDWGWDFAHWELENWREYRKETQHPTGDYSGVEELSPQWFGAVQAAWKKRKKKALT